MDTKKSPEDEIQLENPASKQEKTSDGVSKKDQEIEASSPKEFGGPKGLNPTRYGDWERKGRCVDF